MVRSLVLIVALSVIVAAAAIADEFLAPPIDTLGLAKADLSYADLLAKHRAAVGTANTKVPSVERARLRVGDLDGTVTVVRAGDDYREDTTIGPLHRAEGRLDTRRWTQDVNGVTRSVEGVHDASQAEPPVAPAVIGINTALHAYVVAEGAPDRTGFSFYDQTSFLLVRRERNESQRWSTTTDEDYARIDGEMRARHRKTDDGQPYGFWEETIESTSHPDVFDRTALEIPATRPTLSFPGGRVRLPAKIVSDRIIVATQIGARKVNFQMDSGASTIVLDSGVADALKFPEYGHATETVAGTFTAREALAPSIAVGPLVLKGLYVETGPADMSIGVDTPVAGLLGADFLSSCVFAIDYAGGTVDAIDADTFVLPKDAVVLPARFDDGVPTIEARIGAAKSREFIIDTGADRSMLFTRFVTAHPHETSDVGLGAAETAASPFRHFIRGVGGLVTVRTLEASDFALGSISFARWPFLAVTGGPNKFESDDYDGLIGQDVLRYFTVYLDYPHGRIVLVPNSRYTARFS